MRRARVWSPVVAALLTAGGVQAQCTKDVDCSGAQICEAGVCTQTPDATTIAQPAAATAPAAAPPAATEKSRVVGGPRVIYVKSAPVARAKRYERRSEALMTLGSIASAAGAASLLIGAMSGDIKCHRELRDDFKVQHCESTPPSYAAYAIGGLLLASGVTMIVIGAQRVQVQPFARLAPWLSPRSGGLTLKLQL